MTPRTPGRAAPAIPCRWQAAHRGVPTARGARGDGQATLQHTKKSTYGCFRQDLTGFSGIPLSRTQPPPPNPRALLPARPGNPTPLIALVECLNPSIQTPDKSKKGRRPADDVDSETRVRMAALGCQVGLKCGGDISSDSYDASEALVWGFVKHARSRRRGRGEPLGVIRRPPVPRFELTHSRDGARGEMVRQPGIDLLK